MGLIAQILEERLDGGPPPGRVPARGDFVGVRCDQALAGGVAAVVALAAYEALGLERVRTEVVVVGAERHAPQAAFESADELRELQQTAHRVGARFSRPGDGRCERVHLERFAAPTRVLAAAGRRAPVAGAVGMLVLPVGALELAAVLAAQSIEFEWPGSLTIALAGSPGLGVDSHDAALALHARLDGIDLAERFVEFAGAALERIDMETRVALVTAANECGARSSLFPSDEVTRLWLEAEGRESDWKRLTADEEPAEGSLAFDLDTLEPLTAPLERRAAARPVRELRGTTINAVLIGPGASAADLARFARLLGERRVSADVRALVVPGTRQVHETARRDGTLDRLIAAGVEVTESGAPPVPAVLGLCCGADTADLAPGRARWQAAGIATCAVAAIAGVLEDPRVALDSVVVARSPDAPFAPDEGPRLGTAAGESTPRPEFPIGTPFVGALRGVVLVRLGDDVGSDRIVPWGARVRPLVGDLQALAEFTLDDVAPGFAARARAAGGGFVVAGAGLGSGVAWDTAALALLGLGVRAILARGIAPEFARLAARAGILPLEFANDSDAIAIAEGDDLEIPGLPEAMAPGRALVVRNLTQGTQYTVRHPLGAAEVQRLSLGGLLATLRRPA